jgi:hypothetical protein
MVAKSGTTSAQKSTTLSALEKVIWKLGLDDPLCLRQGVSEISQRVASVFGEAE